jgi:hypothetical protein
MPRRWKTFSPRPNRAATIGARAAPRLHLNKKNGMHTDKPELQNRMGARPPRAQRNAPPRSAVCAWNATGHLKTFCACGFPARAREMTPGAGAPPHRLKIWQQHNFGNMNFHFHPRPLASIWD